MSHVEEHEQSASAFVGRDERLDGKTHPVVEPIEQPQERMVLLTTVEAHVCMQGASQPHRAVEESMGRAAHKRLEVGVEPRGQSVPPARLVGYRQACLDLDFPLTVGERGVLEMVSHPLENLEDESP